MHPFLFSFGDVRVPAYGVVYLVAFLAAVGFFAWYARRPTGLPFLRLFEMGFQVAIAGEIGARVAFVVVEWDRFAAGAIGFRQFLVGGRVVLGGIVAGAAYAAYVWRKNAFPVGATLDPSLTGTTLGMAIGRLGCYLAGCCYGRETDAAWAVTFSDPAARALHGTPLGVPLHPTQLVQFATALALFVFLWVLLRRGAPPWVATGWFFATGGAMRIAMEFLRGDARGEWMGITTSQWIGTAMCALGLAILFAAHRRAEGAATPSPERA